MSEVVSAVFARLFSEKAADYISCGHLSYNLPNCSRSWGLRICWRNTFSLKIRKLKRSKAF